MKPRILSVARLALPLAAAIAALLTTPSVNATPYYWDTNGAAGYHRTHSSRGLFN